MEANAPLTRKRRKPVHSTKCPCCSDDRGKPEKEPRRRRREDVDLEPSNTTAGDDRSTSTKRTQVTITNSKVIETVNQSSSEVDDEEICEGRVLRSGQSTPVPSEFENEKTNGRSKKANSKKVAKKSVLATQKGSRKSKKPPGNSDVEKKKGKRSLAQDSDNFKPISKNTESAQATRAKKKSSQATQGSDQVEKISKKGEEKPTRQSIKKPSKRKHVKLPPVHRKSLVTKTLAIDKLKIRAFDNLKEKLEIAFEQNSLTVPECVELFQKITSENLKAILESDEGPAMKGRASEESGDDLTEEVTDSGSEARAMEKKLAENMNESEAAKALVSFKVQTTAVNSTLIQSRTNSTSQELQNSKELMNSLPSQGNAISSTNNPLKSLDNLTATMFAGLTGLPLNKPLKATEVQASAAPSVILQTAPVPSIPIVQAPMTFQLLQVPSQATKGNHPGDLQGTPLQKTSGFIYQNPTAMINQLTSVNQQATGLFPPTLNQLLYLTKLNQQHDGKSVLNPNFCGFLPGMQAQDQALYSSASGSVTCTSLANTTISTLGPTSTNNNEIQSSTKLRPILPREPLVTPSFPSFASQGLTLGTSSSTLSKVTTPSSNTVHVKQEIKRMVSERTKANDILTPEVTTSLPDIASTFAKSSVRPTSSLESYQSEAPSGPKYSIQQEATEMTSKEQAIKALLSIGGNGSLLHGNGEPDGSSNRSNETNGLRVVFESDKGIFKVDDVTIDPLVNTISKESYTCGKCSKIFTSLSYLARHIKRVCPDMSHRKWKCNHCDKAFRHPFGLQQHIYTHTGERPHKCPQCPKAFYSSNDLRRHSRIHSGERPYKCKHCGKSFATTISLKTHTFIHTGEKPHRCPHCTKTFATSSKLGRHIVTHSEQRPYSCNQCPKTFNRSGDLRRHTLHVHDSKITDNPNTDQQEQKIYRCTECSGAFDMAKELEAHINEHTTEITQKMFVPHDLS